MTLKLKQEYKDFYKANRITIKECEGIFFTEDNKYLHTHKLPESWKLKINHLWFTSPLSKIQDGFHNNGIMNAETEDLKRDNICGKNLNKEYWIQSYMLAWLECLPETATADYLFNHIESRKAFILMLKNAYEKVEK